MYWLIAGPAFVLLTGLSSPSTKPWSSITRRWTTHVDALFQACDSTPGSRLAIDLQTPAVTWPCNGRISRFKVDPARRERLLHGLDDIAMTISHADKIRAYEAWRRQQEDWAL